MARRRRQRGGKPSILKKLNPIVNKLNPVKAVKSQVKKKINTIIKKKIGGGKNYKRLKRAIVLANKARTIANTGVLGQRIKRFANNRMLVKGLNFAQSQLGAGFKGTMYNRGKRRKQKGGVFPIAALAGPLLGGVLGGLIK